MAALIRKDILPEVLQHLFEKNFGVAPMMRG
jgi:hypothetical protein